MAAIAGQVGAVSKLLERGAELTSHDKDLYTWTCLCLLPQKREEILDIVFKEPYRNQIHPNFPKVYQQIPTKGNDGTSIPRNDLNEGIESGYPLSPFNAAILSNSTEYFPPDVEGEIRAVHSSDFNGMNSRELARYRRTVHKILKSNGFGLAFHYVDKPTFDKFDQINLLIQFGDIEAIRALLKEVDFEDEARAAPIFQAIKHGKFEILAYLFEKFRLDLNSDLIPPREDIHITLSSDLLRRALFFSCIEVLEYLHQHNRPIFDNNPRLLDPISLGQMEIVMFMDRHGLLHIPYQDERNHGITPLYQLLKDNHEKKLCEFFGFDKVHPAFLNTFTLFKNENPFINPEKIDQTAESKTYFLPLHLACLLKRGEEVEALLELGQSPMVKATDTSGKEWDMVDFVLYGSEPAVGPLSNQETKQRTLLRRLLGLGFPRETVLPRVRKKCPRLLPELVEPFEETLYEVISHRSFLTKILSGVRSVPTSEGRVIWKQSEQEYPIEDLSSYIREIIEALVGKDESSTKKIPLDIRKELSELVITPTTTFIEYQVPISEEKILLLCAILEKIHEVSQEIAPFEHAPENQIPTTVRWSPKEDSEDLSQKPKRQKMDSESSASISIE